MPKHGRNIGNREIVLITKSVNASFQERCVGGAKTENFRNNIIPYLSKKHISSEFKIIMSEKKKFSF